MLPLGLSFYSFKIISYLADIYSGKRENAGDWLDYAIYVSFFPQILSGPISRSDEIMGKMEHPFFSDHKALEEGLWLIVSGAFLKLVIAERIVGYVDTVFGNFQMHTGLALWLAAFLYSIQIYCDFAGYSYAAIGVARLMGFSCRPNFNRPYLAKSIPEFWSRWHISLSSWLRDYIYIPLGGNRRGQGRKSINLLLTFLISGFWHGSGSGYVVWGLYHGVLSLFPRPRKDGWRGVLAQAGTFAAVTLGWIFFRLEDAGAGLCYIARMFTALRISPSAIMNSILPFTSDNSCVSFFLTACFFICAQWIFEEREEQGRLGSKPRQMFLLLSILLFGMIGSGSFIYMNY